MNNHMASSYDSPLPSKYGPEDRISQLSDWPNFPLNLNIVPIALQDRTGFNDQTQDQLEYVFRAIDSAERNPQSSDLDLVEEAEVKSLLDLMSGPGQPTIQTCLAARRSPMSENVSQDHSFGSLNPNDQSFIGNPSNPLLMDSILKDDWLAEVSRDESISARGPRSLAPSMLVSERFAPPSRSPSFIVSLGKHTLEDYTRENLTEVSQKMGQSAKRVKF